MTSHDPGDGSFLSRPQNRIEVLPPTTCPTNMRTVTIDQQHWDSKTPEDQILTLLAIAESAPNVRFEIEPEVNVRIAE